MNAIMVKYRLKRPEVLSREGQDRLILKNYIRVVRTVAKHNPVFREMDRDDFEGVVALTLVIVARSFDPARYADADDEEIDRLFVGYVYRPARSAVFREFQRMKSKGIVRDREKKSRCVQFSDIGSDERGFDPGGNELPPDVDAMNRETMAEAAERPLPYAAWYMSEYGRSYLVREYVERRRSTYELAGEVGLDPTVIRRALLHHGLKIRGR